jgi:hypothetical protein
MQILKKKKSNTPVIKDFHLAFFEGGFKFENGSL